MYPLIFLKSGYSYRSSIPRKQNFHDLFSPCGKWFAVGGADAIVSIWDAYEYIPVRTISRLEWPVRTLSFSHNGKLLAAASEDHVIDISHVSNLIKKYRGCVFPMVVISLLPHGEFGRNDHREDAPHFTSRQF